MPSLTFAAIGWPASAGHSHSTSAPATLITVEASTKEEAWQIAAVAARARLGCEPAKIECSGFYNTRASWEAFFGPADATLWFADPKQR